MHLECTLPCSNILGGNSHIQLISQNKCLTVEEILHHLLHMKPYEKWNVLNVNWLAGFPSINNMLLGVFVIFRGHVSALLRGQVSGLLGKKWKGW